MLILDRNQNQNGMSTITVFGSNFDDITNAIDQIMGITGEPQSHQNFNESNSFSNQQNRNYNESNSFSNHNYNEPKPFSNESPRFQERNDDFVAIDWQAAARESVIIEFHVILILSINKN